LDAWLSSHSHLERETDFRNLSTTARRALERGRLGDAQAIPDLAPLLKSSDAAVRREAAHLLARLPADEHLRPPVPAAPHEAAAGPWAAAALARFCDEKSDGKSNDAEWSARVGIARAKCGHADLALLEAGLRTDDVSLRKQVILAMGECRDPKAVAMLLDQLT